MATVTAKDAVTAFAAAMTVEATDCFVAILTLCPSMSAFRAGLSRKTALSLAVRASFELATLFVALAFVASTAHGQTLTALRLAADLAPNQIQILRRAIVI